MLEDKSIEIKFKKTKAAYLWTSGLRAPFWAIYNLLLFILYKDLKASPFEIALFIGLKPAVSLLSIYWGSFVNRRPDRLLSNIIWAGIIGHLPFLFFPFIYNVPYVLFASAVYMTMVRGVVPGWMEIFKLNLQNEERQKVFSTGSIISYIGGSIFPIIIGPLLDHVPLSWRMIFAVSALLGIGACLFQRQIPIVVSDVKKESFSITKMAYHPWKKSWQVFKEKADFRSYLIGFMIFGGGGLMLIQPALPKFFIDHLGLSYTALSLALTLCKGVAFALTSNVWAKAMSKMDFFKLGGFVTLFGVFYILTLISASFTASGAVFVAYFIYGIMQAGSELSWHLSGPHFAKDEDSTLFSNANVLITGVRGVVIPQIGSLFCFFMPSPLILSIGALSCLTGTLWIALTRRAKQLSTS